MQHYYPWYKKDELGGLFNHSHLPESQKQDMTKQVIILALLVLVGALSASARAPLNNQASEGKEIECEEGHTPCLDVCCDIDKRCCHGMWCDYPIACQVKSPFE